MDTKRFAAKDLTSFAAQVLHKAGTRLEDAQIVADSLVEADLRGVSSHGLSRLAIYSKRLSVGVVNGHPTIELLREKPSALVIDGDNGMGAVVAAQVMDMCIERARRAGTCWATVRNGNHFGIAAYYGLRAVRNGMIGVAISNAPPSMAAWGGVDPIVGTNPLCVAIPAGKYEPFVLDMATSVVARGKIILAAKEGKPIPENWALDKDGLPTTDAKVAMEGTSLPFGGPKGYAISLIHDILGGVMGGALFGTRLNSLWDNFTDAQNLGFFIGAIDISAFIDLDEFNHRIEAMIADIKSSRCASGVSEILIPGEIEFQNKARLQTEGLEYPEVVVEELRGLAKTYQVSFPNPGGEIKQTD